MSKLDLLEKTSIENNGILQLRDVVRLGISKTYALEWIKKNEYEQVASGIYLAPDAWEDGMYVLQMRYKEAVFSHETALYLLNMADREPLQYTVTLKHGYNPQKLNARGIKAYTIKAEWYDLGIIEVDTNLGHMVRTYNAERTLCDIFKSNSQVEIQDSRMAVREYVSWKEKNIPLLMEYAKLFKVDKKIRTYLEVLL